MSNLLDKASILLTPTAYSDGTLHSVKPVQTFGSELVTNGDFSSDTDWAVNAGWSISDGKANIDTDDGTDIFSQSSVLVVGKKYKLSLIANVTVGSIKFESGEGDNLIFTSDIDSHIFIADRTQVVFRRQTVPTRGYIDNVSIVEVTDGDFDFTRATTATRVGPNGLIQNVAGGLPRIDFLGGTGQILLEPASTNKITQSEQITNGGNTPQRIDSTQDVAVAPDGTTTADLCIPNTVTGSHQPYQYRDDDTSTSFADGSNYAFSVFVKPNTTNGAQFVQMSTFISTGGSNVVNFDIVNGTITQTGFVSSNIENYGNGWFRCSFVFEALRDSTAGGNDGWALGIITAGDSSRSESFTGDGSSNGVLVWGAQFEEVKDFATSYIPTSGSTVTRNKDQANNSGDSSLINSTEGVIYAELRMLERTSDDFSKPVSIGDGTTSGQNNSVFIVRLASQEDQFGGSIRNPDGSSAFFSFTVTNSNEFFKFALQYKSSENKMFVNGTQIGTTNGLTINLNTLDRLNLSNSVGNEPAEARIKCVAVFKEALTDAELIALTS
jgi:hypothetical protein